MEEKMRAQKEMTRLVREHAFHWRMVLVAILAGTLLGCGGHGRENAPSREMMRGGIPAGWGMAYGRIYPGPSRLYVRNRATRKSQTIATDREGNFFVLLPAGDYVATQLRRANFRMDYRYRELAPEFSVPAGRAVYLGDLKVRGIEELQLRDEFERATQRLRDRYPGLPAHPAPAKSMMYRPTAKADNFIREGKYAEALEIVNRMRTQAEKRYGRWHMVVGVSLRWLASIAHHQNRQSEAADHLEKAQWIFEKTYGPNHIYVARIKYDLGMVYLRQERNDEAKRILQDALRIYQQNYGPDHPNIRQIRKTLEQYGVVINK